MATTTQRLSEIAKTVRSKNAGMDAGGPVSQGGSNDATDCSLDFLGSGALLISGDTGPVPLAASRR